MTQVCAVIGVGPGNGQALVRRFSQEGYQVAMLARSQDYLEQLAGEIPNTHAYPYDVTDTGQAGAVFGRIREAWDRFPYFATTLVREFSKAPKTRLYQSSRKRGRSTCWGW